ncbi:MAG TPA: BREX system ATP-binding domain-containing protein [Methylomirabilota bacterium]
MAKLGLTLLGGFQARLDTGEAFGLPTRKAQALLAYLALPPGQAHPRDKLAALLWGGIREESARASLRQALFSIRKALGAIERDVLRQEGDALSLVPGAIEVDAVLFQQHVAEGTVGSLEQAATLYRGDLLSGFAVDESPFEEWLLGERERLREVALEGLARLLAQQRRTGASEAAVQTALRLLTLDPLQEAVHRALMRLYADLGRRGTALRQYQQCVAVLGRELGIEPEPETKTLYQEILRQRPLRPSTATELTSRQGTRAGEHRAPGAGAETVLVGRESERQALRAALERVVTEGGGVIAVLGEAGIGKSRLVAELTAEAAARGMTVLLGRAYESEQILPFGPWVDAVRAGRVADDAETLDRLGPALRVDLARLFPEIGGVAPTSGVANVRPLFESLAQLVRHLAARQPVLLVLEDLHWADELSARLVAFVGRRLAGTAVLLVVTAREDELAEVPALQQALDDLRRDAALTTLPLRPLSHVDTLALVRGIARIGDQAALDRLGERAWAASEGNPFVAVETVRAQAEGAVVPGRDLALPERVREIVTKRLQRLSQSGQMLAAVAAVIGREFDFTLLQRASGLSDEEAAAGVEELVRHRILHGLGERFDFTHDRIRETAYRRILVPRRRLLHRRAAEAIEELHAGDLARHALALGQHYREAELWEPAVVHLTRAALDAFARAASREALACFESALAAIDRLPEGPVTTGYAIDVRLDMAMALMNLGEFRRSLDRMVEAEALARAADDQGRLGRILSRMAYDLASLGDFSAALVKAEAALAIAAQTDDRASLISVNVMIARILYGAGQYGPAIDAARRTLDLVPAEDRAPSPKARRFSVLSNISFSRFWLVVAMAEVGKFQEGAVLGVEAVAIARALGRFQAVVALLGLGRLRVVQGALGPAIEILEEALPLCETSTDLALYFSRTASSLGEAYVRSGRVAGGLTLLERAASHAEEIGFVFGHALFVAMLGEGRLVAGDTDGAAADAERALALSRRHGQRGWEAWALRLDAAVAARREPGDLAAIETRFGAAAALAGELGMRPLLAHCSLGLGVAYRAAGMKERASKASAAALTEYRAMDMPYWVAQAEHALGTA